MRLFLYAILALGLAALVAYALFGAPMRMPPPEDTDTYEPEDSG